MSTTFWIALIIVLGICTYVFTKTVSNDAENDYRLRDILSSDSEGDSSKENEKVSDENSNLKKADYNPEQEKNIYEEIAEKANEEKKNYENYSTNVHESSEATKESPVNTYAEKVYYEKINDDACEPDNTFEDDNEGLYKVNKEECYPKRRSLFDYVKTFWRSITFTVGLLICLCAFFCLTAQTVNSNDAIVYSIWLLIGVILIK